MQITDAYHRFLRQKNRLFGSSSDRWALDQHIPIQWLCRTAFDYDVTYYGVHEIYQPDDQRLPHERAYRNLGLHYTPQVLPRPYFFTVSDAVVYERQVIDPQNPKRLFLETFPEPTMNAEGSFLDLQPSVRRRMRRNISTEIDHGFLFSALWWRNHYHFFVDSCLRFIDLRSEGAVTDETRILVHSKPRPWQVRCMEILGISNEQIVVTDHPITVGQLLIASPRRNRFAVSRSAAATLRTRFVANPAFKGAPGYDKIYITRSNAKRRRVLNEDALVRFLSERGYKTLALEDLTLEEQVASFAHASHVLAPHGAGLGKILFSDAPNVIEFLPDDRWSLGYFIALCNSIGGRHIAIVSEAENTDDDFHVSIDQLAALV